MDANRSPRRERFGSLPDGTPVHVLRLGSPPSVVLRVLTLGAAVQGLDVTGGDGRRRDVALGLGSVESYLASSEYIGAVIGRYANRIAEGRFDLDGTSYEVGAHDRGHSLHGGPDGFDRRVWRVAEQTEDRAVLELRSPDGDQGFPGALRVRASYAVEGDQVRLVLEATPDAVTVVNLTSHLYLDLDASGSVADHELQVDADAYTPVDETGIPLGEHATVSGTRFDLREPARLGERMPIDHNLVLRGDGLREVATLSSRRARTRMVLACDRPGLQVFTAGTFDGTRVSKNGTPYRAGAGVAMEPQLFPDSPHHPEWPTARVGAGETTRSEITWSFSALPGA